MKISYSKKQIIASISAAEIMDLLEGDSEFYLCHLIYTTIKRKVMEDARKNSNSTEQLFVQYTQYYDLYQVEVSNAGLFKPYGNEVRFSYQVMNWIETNCGVRCRHLDSLKYANVTKLPGGGIFDDEKLRSSNPREIRRIILAEMIRRNAPDLEIKFMNI